MKVVDGRVRFESQADLPPTAISIAGTTWNRTGSWKFLEPFYRDLTPPCSGACLTEMDVVGMMRAVEAGDWDRAARVAIDVNPFPAITGRLCPRPCEQPCNRKAYGGAVSVRSIERAVGDHKLLAGVAPTASPATLERVHVVGAGPAGLSAAVALRRLGHPVTVHSASRDAGGSLLRGVASFRLPPAVVRDEVDWTRRLGVDFEAGPTLSRADVDALGPTVLATGARHPRAIEVPGASLPGVYDASALLDAVRRGGVTSVGASAAVVGGGALALDVARTLRRLGARAVVVHRGPARDLAAHRAEVEDAKAEGVEFEFDATPTRIDRGPGGALRLSVVVARPDGPSPRTHDVSAVVAALGADVEPTLAPTKEESARGHLVPGAVRLSDRLVAAGACAGLEASVSDVIRAGRVAAHALHSSLVGRPVPAASPLRDRGCDGEVAKFKALNLAWFEREAPRVAPTLAPADRLAGFRPVEGALGAGLAQEESARCFKCGTCVECDICFQYCPDVAIEKRPEGGYAVDLAHCKGCGVCATECPRAALHLRKSS